MMNARALLLILAIASFASCRNDREERATKGTEYFPIKIGTVKIYDVDTINYNPFNLTVDTISHEIREEVVEMFVDAAQDTVYRVELSTYSTEKSMWIPFRSLLRKVKDNYAIEAMENVQEVKLLFPIAQYKTKGSNYVWNTNMFNASEPVMVKYTSVFSSYFNGIRGFNDCVSVKLNKPLTGRVNDVREEVYAKNVGLVYRFRDSTDNLNLDTTSGRKIIIRLK